MLKKEKNRVVFLSLSRCLARKILLGVVDNETQTSYDMAYSELQSNAKFA